VTPETIQTVVIFALAAAAIAGMAALGVHRPGPLGAAPGRRMQWGLAMLAMGFGAFLLGGVAYGAVAGGLTDAASQPEAMPPEQLMMLTLLAQAMIQGPTAAVLILAATRQAGGMSRIGLADSKVVRHVAIGLLGLVLVLPVVFATSLTAGGVVQWLGGEAPEIGHRLLEPMFEADRAVRLGFFASAIVVAPVLEEMIFRGLLQTTLLNLAQKGDAGPVMQRIAAILGTTALFLALHVGDASPHAMPALAVLSIGLGYLYERTGSLWAPIAAHAGFNAVNVALAAIMLG